MSNNDYVNGKIVFNDINSSKEYIYQEVLDDFINAKKIYISTYSLGSTDVLIKYLKKKEDVNVTLITNIPSSENKYKKEDIDEYLKMLETNKYKNIELYFNNHNHTKIVATENILYLGSQNFTYGSMNSYEIGVITKDKQSIDRVIEKFNIIKGKSVRCNNYKYIKIRDELVKQVIQLEHILSNITNIISDESLAEINNYIIDQRLFFSEFSTTILEIISEKTDEYDNYIKVLDEELFEVQELKTIEIIETIDSEYSKLMIYNKIIKDKNLNDDFIDKYITGCLFDYVKYNKDSNICIDSKNIYVDARVESYIVIKCLKELLRSNKKSINILEIYIDL